MNEMACEIKVKALELIKEQIMGDISLVDSKELGEIADIAKDMAELIKYCEEAEYFETVVDYMKEHPEEYVKNYKDRMYYSSVNRKKSLDDYLTEITEMINGLNANEKVDAKQKLSQMVSRI